MATKIKRAILYIALIILGLMCLLPFWLMMVNSTRSGVEITHSFSFLPGHSLKDNWKVLFDYVNLFLGLFNSFKVAVPATLLTAYFSAITAFGMAMYNWKGNNVLFRVIVVFMMIPAQLSLIGFYNLCQKLHLIDSYIPLIIPAIASPGIVFFLRQYTKATLSKSLMEAARIDGASEIHIFHRIVLPIMAPGIATMSIGTFIGNWNSYLVPLILLNTPKKMTLPVMISTLNAATDLQKNQGAIYLGVAISVVPIIIAFCFFSKYIISSISAGSVKE
ncbi:carbohydrate ABC transporter permease [Butyrivibrio sp. VCB2001]|jgi:multiple sugar transport system permease protein|uniref:carbohydrate ABC transporter permease n=1 Tax=Butyrivibrio sp. VCB2001 TaxID=1280667 RepID=UPI00041ED074|nr:carbohydrate ABC transporter permease [Butyrivibrio sp. VCB2001]MBP3825070.1 carbohydrate ABC transporter permease [Butyrivibrio sp.]